MPVVGMFTGTLHLEWLSFTQKTGNASLSVHSESIHTKISLEGDAVSANYSCTVRKRKVRT